MTNIVAAIACHVARLTHPFSHNTMLRDLAIPKGNLQRHRRFVRRILSIMAITPDISSNNQRIHSLRNIQLVATLRKRNVGKTRQQYKKPTTKPSTIYKA